MKLAWPLAAAVASVLIVVIAWTLLSMGLPSAERLGASETVDGIEVPVIGTVGDFPEPAHRHVVNVTADGHVTIDGAAFADFDALAAELRRRADDARESFSEDVVLRADRRAPWGVGQLLLAACSDAGIRRVFFAVRQESDDTEGAVYAFRPERARSARVGADEVIHRVVVWPSDGSGTPEAVFGHLVHSRRTPRARLVVLIDVDARVTFGFTTRLLDAAVRSGADDVRFVLSEPAQLLSRTAERMFDAQAEDRVAYRTTVLESLIGMGGFGDDDMAKLHEFTPGEVAPAMPRIPRVRGRFAGLSE